MQLDHIALSATTLGEGVAHVEAALGVTLAPGGKHAYMSTYNRLLGLGDVYLEVIAIDPDAPPPGHSRWFDLDNFTGQPRLTNWIMRSDDLDVDVAASPDGAGVPVALSRNDLSWRMAVPATGRLPLQDTFPALMQWNGSVHPVQKLADVGVRLVRLEITTPEADALNAALSGRLDDPRLSIAQGPQKVIRAEFSTPDGRKWL
ncbi:MAG: polyphosphate kinase [Cereibacter sphaeroides]|uniref:Polyphosphate kinase n=1 Tax=Cereibacter sphaeroides TaxID=1063 RepID=A0A2W5SE75_CERSP|nr:MAG: polyphosphate kinase [Cereibacter sphaeroides]